MKCEITDCSRPRVKPRYCKRHRKILAQLKRELRRVQLDLVTRRPEVRS